MWHECVHRGRGRRAGASDKGGHVAGKIVRRGGVVAFIVGVSTVLAIPAFAYASHTTKTVGVASGAQGTATAICPAGQHITFGGIGAPLGVPLGSGPEMFPQQFFADSTQTKWTTVAVNGKPDDMNHPANLTSHAYCGPHSTRTVVTKTVSVASGNVGVATATCPAGKVVLGGGYKTPPVTPYPYTLITRLRAPTSTSVEVAAVHFAQTPTTTLTAIAYCGDGPALTEVTAAIAMN